MQISLNWFEVEFSSYEQSLPTREFGSWEESRAAHEELKLSEASFSRKSIYEEEGKADDRRAKTFLLGDLTTLPEGFTDEYVDLRTHWQVAAKAVEFNLDKYLCSKGLHIHRGKFGIDATKPVFIVDEIGLSVEAGISFKSHYLRSERKHGITLDWTVRQHFRKALSDFSDLFDEALGGIPVLLTKKKSRLDADVEDYAGRYLGVVTSLEASDAVVSCRDGVKRRLSRELLYPEARGDVVSRLAAKIKNGESSDSLIRRIQVAAFALTPTNRRNLKVQQDKLQAAISFLHPDHRPLLTIDLQPFLAGKLRVSSEPAIARIERTQYV